MKRIIFALILSLIALPVLNSCKEEPKKSEPATEAAPVKTETQTQESATDNTALNPAHGQPNHRCDIPVGAPLNSPPKSNTQTQSPLINGGSNSGSAKVNPPHGQPGHRCDIKVGAPL